MDWESIDYYLCIYMWTCGKTLLIIKALESALCIWHYIPNHIYSKNGTEASTHRRMPFLGILGFLWEKKIFKYKHYSEFM